MSFLTFPPTQYLLHGGDCTPPSGDQLYQVLEVRLRFFHRLISGSPYAGVPHQILHETPPIHLENVLFPLPLHRLDLPQFLRIYVEQLLSSLNIRDASCVGIAWQIVSYVFRLAAGDREMNFHIVADIDNIQTTWLEPIPSPRRSNNNGALVEETMILEEAFPEAFPEDFPEAFTETFPESFPAAFPRERRGLPKSAMERLRMEKLEEEELGDCSICLDEFDCKRREVVKIPCGHVYHQPCIFKWLENYNSCPLCRRPLPLEKDS